jgi:hypothetical protein
MDANPTTNCPEENVNNDVIKETCNYDTPKRSTKHAGNTNTRKNRHNNFMKATVSFLNKQRTKYEAVTTYPKMSFGVTADTLSRNTSTASLRRSYQWNDTNVFEDTLKHFTSDNYGSDPYNHFD